MLNRVIRLSLTVVGLSLLSLILILLILISTQTGSRWLIYQLIDIGDIPLQINTIEGRLFDDIRFLDLHYQQEDSGVSIRANRIHVNWTATRLLAAHIEIKKLLVDGLEIIPGQSESGTGTKSPEFPVLPVTVSIADLRLTDSHLLIDATDYPIERVHAALEIRRDKIRLQLIESFGLDQYVQGEAIVINARPIAINVDLDWQGEVRAQPYKGHLELDGSQRALKLAYSVEGAVSATGKGELNLDSEPLGFNLQSEITGELPESVGDYITPLSPTEINLVGNITAFETQLHSRFKIQTGEIVTLTMNSHVDMPHGASDELQVKTHWQTSPESGTDLLTMNADTRISYRSGVLSLDHQMTAPFDVSMHGEISLNNETTLDLSMMWQEVTIALKDMPSVYSQRGNLQLNGPVGALVIEGQSHLRTESIGNAQLELTALWTEPTLSFQRVELMALGGNISGNGPLSIEPEISGQFELSARDINLETIDPDLRSQLDAQGRIGFSLRDEVLDGKLDLLSVSGQWRGFPITGQATMEYIGGTIQIRELHLESDDNRIDVTLDINDTLNGLVDLRLSDMSLITGRMSGTAMARFDISGTIKKPGLSGSLSGKEIRFDEVSIAEIEVKASLTPGSKDYSSLAINATDLNYQEWSLNRLEIMGQGSMQSHSVTVGANNETLQLKAQVDGQLQDNDAWRGLINQLELDTAPAGLWQLNQTVTVRWDTSTQLFDMGQLCLTQNSASVCLVASGDQDEKLSAEIKLASLPLALAKPWLPETVSSAGMISGDILYRRDSRQSQTQINLRGSDTRISIGFEDSRETLDMPKASLSAEISNDRQVWSLMLGAPGYFDINMTGEIKTAPESRISAQLRMDLQRLDWLQGMEPAFYGTKGRFSARTQISGSLNRPQVQGEFKLLEGQISILPLGLKLDKFQGQLQSANKEGQIAVRSQIISEGKSLELSGHINLLTQQDQRYAFTLRGEDFPVLRTTDISLDATPDLKLYGNRELLNIRGQVKIPQLDLRVTSMPENTIRVSQDTVIVGEGKNGVSSGGKDNSNRDFIRNHLDIEIKLIVGKEVRVRAFGLDTRLTGDLKVVKPIGIYQPRGEGLLTLAEGSYQAYGQNLVIEEGQIQFAGPLNNPALNVRAYRPGLDVRAGVRVTGDIRQPQVTLYSEPELSDADTLSYLITGRPISGVSSSEDASLLSQAALALGTSESAVLADKIRNIFGLDQLSVDAGSTLETSSIVAGKKLSPNLTLRSSYNPFDQLWTFFLTYRLTEHWSVQTESGDTQGGDIIYSVESNRFIDLIKKIWSLDR